MKLNTESFLEGYFHSFMYLVVFATPVIFLFLDWLLSLVFFISNLCIFLILRSWLSRSRTVHELIPKAHSSANTMGFIINFLFVLLVALILTIIYFSTMV